MKRILVFGITENPGGVENFILNYYRDFDRTRVQLDFLCNPHQKVAFEGELLSLGARVYHICSRKENRFRFYKELEQVFSEHAKEWSVIWVNVNSLANIDYLKVAKRYAIPKRIIHSHNAENMDGWLRGILHFLNKKIISYYATDFWACSESAAKWFYDDKRIKKTVIIQNAIDGTRYKYDECKRRQIRSKLKATESTYIIGNIGRLHFQKNQSFLLDVMKEYDELNTNWLLVLVGQGEDEKKLKGKCKRLGIEDKVVFAGVQNDIQAWLSGFDIFVFPSVFEGLGIAALEAQANGLPVIASEGVIPYQVKLTEKLVFVGLDKSAYQWAERIESMRESVKRTELAKALETLKKQGYDVVCEAKKLENKLLQDCFLDNMNPKDG